MGDETEIVRESGFSVIELLVVMAVMAILAAIAIPPLRRVARFTELKRGTQLVSSTFYRARMEAVKSASNCNILFNVAGKSFASNPADGNRSDADLLNDTCVIPAETLPNGISFGWGPTVTKDVSGDSISDTDVDGVTFVTNNTAFFTYLGTATTGTIYLVNELGDTMAVTISSGGRIKTRRWVGTAFK